MEGGVPDRCAVPEPHVNSNDGDLSAPMDGTSKRLNGDTTAMRQGAGFVRSLDDGSDSSATERFE
ncbi:hypothetical protein R69619_00493 [Paraburkholderia nemoris]|nr:hypothetical protein R69619_00493 [Paraburkholderia nemoris]